MKHKYDLKIYNGRVKVYVDGYVMFTFNQIDFKGYYSYKDDTDLYGIDVYLMNEKGGATTMFEVKIISFYCLENQVYTFLSTR